MSTQKFPSLLARLHKDLKELLENPYPGVDVFTDDSNLRKFCLILTPPSGPFKDLALHFDVDLPENWPSSPPRVSSTVGGIEHPNLFGNYICCDLLKEPYARGRDYTGGYSPALTLRGLFLQFLTFFSTNKVEQEYGGFVEIGEMNIVSYIREEEIVARLSLNSRSCCRNRHPCECDNTAQQSYEQLWTDSLYEEQPVATYSVERKPMTQTSKRTEGGIIYKIEQRNHRWINTLERISLWQCQKCPYGTSAFPHHLSGGLHPDTSSPSMAVEEAVGLIAPPVQCQLQKLNIDTLLEVAQHLSSESMVSLSQAYPTFRLVMTSFHLLLHREVRCFFLRTSLAESILGVGVALDPGARTLSSDFDWLSLEAFDSYTVRKSVEKRDFEFFLPLAFNDSHFQKAEGEIWKRLELIDDRVRRAEKTMELKTKKPSNRILSAPTTQYGSVQVLYRMMNNIVVSLMKSCDGEFQGNAYDGSRQAQLLHASEKAIVSYLHLFHLLTRLYRSKPALLAEATMRLRDFYSKPQARLKSHTPDLGELIVLITLVIVLPTFDGRTPMTWDRINGLVLEEAIVRNVRWVLKAHPELEAMEEGASDYRLDTTFTASKTSLRLMMFQLRFLGLVMDAYGPSSSSQSGLALLDSNYGFPTRDLLDPESMVEAIKSIYGVKTWPDFFHRVKYEQGTKFTKAKFCDILRNSVQISGRRDYHQPVREGTRKMEELRRHARLLNAKK